MIILVHKNQKITEIRSTTLQNIDVKSYYDLNLSQVFVTIAEQFSDELIIWVAADYVEELNMEQLDSIFANPLTLQSYTIDPVISDAIGYVDQSPYINVDKQVKYPTWLMSDLVGGAYAHVFNEVYNKSLYSDNFNELISLVAKLAQPLGLLCYSNPNLLKTNYITYKNKDIRLFPFVKKAYKKRWLFILFFNLWIYEKKLPLLDLLKALITNKVKITANLEKYKPTELRLKDFPSVDVIIPTIGRAKYLEKVFELLAIQTHLPNKVIVIEQDAIEGTPTELNFITNKKWPFKVEHQLIYQLGACNARNLALDQVESDYVFFADDDIEFENNLLTSALSTMLANNFEAVTLACLRENDTPFFYHNFQWATFGSGCSIVKASKLKNIYFDVAYEFGFGEDSDFGMQLRNKGCDIIYIPQPQILHLKAPVGGFRTKFIHPWENDVILPKPSPTVMLRHLRYQTPKQILGYKTILFAKFYKSQNVKNPLKYIKIINKRWEKSIEWAHKLNNKQK